MHLKRQKVPKNWPIYRKGTRYVVRPKNDLRNGIPLLVVLRDMLGIITNRKEAKRAIHERNILVNSKYSLDEREGILLFDVIEIVPSKKAFRLELTENGKFLINEIKLSEANEKISKIVDKKVLKGKRTQLNLSDGRNILSDLKCNINDSVILNFKNKKIDKCLALKEGSEAIIFAGKHSGKKGIIKGLDKEKKIAQVEFEDKSINVLIKQLMVIK
ncbi:hypothetical protein K0A97_01725 [Patescibacteria group bacterium]|nr:hypothetical protein [Patescibacteria group bacterium]